MIRKDMIKMGMPEMGMIRKDMIKMGMPEMEIDENGWNRDGIHWSTETKFNHEGWDRDGYDKDGHDKDGN